MKRLTPNDGDIPDSSSTCSARLADGAPWRCVPVSPIRFSLHSKRFETRLTAIASRYMERLRRQNSYGVSAGPTGQHRAKRLAAQAYIQGQQ